MEKLWGEWRLDDEDYYEIAKLVWEDDKKDIIEHTTKTQKEQFGIIVKIPSTISFEEFYREFDIDTFQECDPKNWKYWEEQYISAWKYEHDVMEG